MPDFFDDLDRQKTKETIDILIGLLEEWTLQYPCLGQVRIPPIAFHNAVVMPHLDVSACFLLAKLVLWIFGIDDLIDKHAISPAGLEKIIVQWCTAARGVSDERADDELTAILSEIRKDLSNYKLFQSLYKNWATELRLHVEGMAKEYKYALDYNTHGPSALPSLDSYLHTSVYGLGIPLFALTLFIVLDDSTADVRFESMADLVRYTSVAVRLYNDVQTFEKESEEGNVNSIVILYRETRDRNPNTSRGQALSQAKQRVWKMADSYTQKCYDWGKRMKVGDVPFVQILCNMASFHATFYSNHDYHTTSMTQIGELLGVSLS
jgi:hypothetical protein